MNEKEKEIVRQEILRQLHASAPAKLPAEMIRRLCNQLGLAVTDVELGRELGYLKGKGLVESERAELSQGIERWGIAAAGTDYVERERLG